MVVRVCTEPVRRVLEHAESERPGGSQWSSRSAFFPLPQMGKVIKTRKVEDPNKAGGVNREKARLDMVPAVSSLRSGGVS